MSSIWLTNHQPFQNSVLTRARSVSPPILLFISAFNTTTPLMSATRRATDLVSEKVRKVAKDWKSVASLRPFEVEEFLRFLSLLTNLAPAGEVIKRTARFNRQKAAQNLALVVRGDAECGPMLVFWLSVSSTMTQLGRINVKEFLRQMRERRPACSPRLQNEVKTLLQRSYLSSLAETLSTGAPDGQGTKGISLSSSESNNRGAPNETSHTSGESVIEHSPRVEVTDSFQNETATSIRRYELPFEYLVEFLRRLNGGPAVEMTVEHSVLSQAPYITLKGLPEGRLHLNHELSSVLLKRIIGAETVMRADGTIVLVSCKKA